MKVLKSGIEIDPRKLKKIKGGSCCCYCDFGISSTCVQVPGTEGEICLCSCTTEPTNDASFRMVKYK